eukprot:TRINITY_DN22503_c0_g1_i1.p1 TRINITY_DN22503_c0_g1~~TRINITY_DN22503_c0_g1_i1.p1  ORF type:complete len:204 (+),score=39.05 TRINITY_DN22503_c0_g1_i1:53-664(+)
MPVVMFHVSCNHTHVGDRVVIAGDKAVAGCWDPSKSQILFETQESCFPWWVAHAHVDFCRMEYKFVITDASGEVRCWEDVSNRLLYLGDDDVEIKASFGVPGEFEEYSTGNDFRSSHMELVRRFVNDGFVIFPGAAKEALRPALGWLRDAALRELKNMQSESPNQDYYNIHNPEDYHSLRDYVHKLLNDQRVDGGMGESKSGA